MLKQNYFIDIQIFALFFRVTSNISSIMNLYVCFQVLINAIEKVWKIKQNKKKVMMNFHQKDILRGKKRKLNEI